MAFALDCCDREAMGFVATTEGIKGEDVQDLMVAAVEHRFGRVNRLPETIEWLTDNGSGYIAPDTRRLPATSVWSRAPRRSRARNQMGWQRRSCGRSSAITYGSLNCLMPHGHTAAAQLVRALQHGSPSSSARL